LCWPDEKARHRGRAVVDDGPALAFLAAYCTALLATLVDADTREKSAMVFVVVCLVE
jgi:hypothetical protein